MGGFWSYILVDLIAFLYAQQDRQLHNIGMLLSAMTFYFIRSTYLHVDVKFLNLLQIFRLDMKRKKREYNQLIKPVSRYYHGKDVILYHKKVSHWISNGFQPLFYIFILHIVMNHYIFIELTIKYRKRLFDNVDDPLNGWSLFLFHCINMAGVDIGITGFVTVCMLACCTFLSLLFFVYIRIKQNHSKLIKKRTAHWSTLGSFIRNDLNNFRFIFIMNKMYGRMFAAFMLVNVPCNAYLIMRLIFKHHTANRISFIVGWEFCYPTILGNWCHTFVGSKILYSITSTSKKSVPSDGE
ncbi:hypothetical protein RDWZM_006865 [Blomia tropicalis]|uniref:Uncharacterized protein n=1 Tax=Blomia tropicalis TaxID=40697 RepID=A0A9Q0M9C1_BLOTA|nr:hypothetical protein RDWZM_006865 [Blomia tropicalis]